MADTPTPKIFQTGAHQMENGRYLVDGSTQSNGWGDASAVKTLGAGDAFPWLAFGNSLTIATEDDNSVTTRAFMTTPRLVGKTVENPIGFQARFKGMNRFYYWMWGFENVVKEVVAFKDSSATGFSGTVAPGDSYYEGANDYTFLRTELIRNDDGTDDKIYVFAATSSAAPVAQAGTLSNGTVAVPIDTETLTFDSHSGVMYEHLFELDSYGRRYRDYSASEKAVVTDIQTNDKRNLMATLGKRMSNYDFKYPNAMINGFTWKVSSAGLADWEANYMAFREMKSAAAGGYGSDTWTLVDGLCDGSLIPTHFEHRMFLGETLTINTNGEISGLTELSMTDANIAVEMPLQSIQSFVSGLSIEEPVLEGKYMVNVTGTISRHTAKTWQEFRDAQTKLVAHIYAHQGWFMQEFLIKEATIPTAGPNDDDVAAEPIELKTGFVCDPTNNQFGGATSGWLYGNTEVHQGPVVFRVRDDSGDNEMLRY